jgi:hypothetical protein
MLFCTGYQISICFKPLDRLADFFAQAFVLCWIVCGAEFPENFEVAVDFIASDKLLDPGERIVTFFQDIKGALRAVFR